MGGSQTRRRLRVQLHRNSNDEARILESSSNEECSKLETGRRRLQRAPRTCELQQGTRHTRQRSRGMWFSEARRDLTAAVSSHFAIETTAQPGCRDPRVPRFYIRASKFELLSRIRTSIFEFRGILRAYPCPTSIRTYLSIVAFLDLRYSLTLPLNLSGFTKG